MVYEPAEDSKLLARNLSKYVQGKSFLDMGTGSGIQSETAQTYGARSIYAVDINPQAVALVKKKGFTVHLSNLFSSVKSAFDVIAFNPPYLPLDKRENKESRQITTGGKNGDEIALRFVRALPKHLSPKGVGLMIVSSLTPKIRLLKLLREKGLVRKVVDREKLFFESLELWRITRKAQ